MNLKHARRFAESCSQLADIDRLDRAIRAQLQTCPKRKLALHATESIKGIGAVAAAAILIEMPEIGT